MRRRRFAGSDIGAVRILLIAALATAGSTATPAAASADTVTGTVLVAPVTLTFALRSSAAAVGRDVKVRVEVDNIGSAPLDAITLRLRLDSTSLLIRGDPELILETLKAGKRARAAWSVCPLRSGSYVVLVQASFDSIAIESPARLLLVSEKHPKSC